MPHGSIKMKKYVAAALTIGIAIGPASALDAGLGGRGGGLGIGAGVSVGGIGVSAGVSVGSQGTSVGAGTSVGGIGVDAGVSAGPQGTSVGAGASVGSVGGANVGASVGAGSVDAGVSGNVGSTSGSVSTSGVGSNASNNPSNTSGSVSAGIGVGADPSADNKSVTALDSPPAAIVPAKTTRQSISLPSVLRPSRTGQGNSILGYPFGSVGPLKMIPGTPAAVVQACRAAIISAATPLGAVRVRVVSAGALRQRGGALTAPIQVRIDYARKGGIEVRQAKVGCRLTAGRVTAII